MPFNLAIPLLEIRAEEIMKGVPKNACARTDIRMLVMVWKEQGKTR